jgi:VCBS repeat-containing protein
MEQQVKNGEMNLNSIEIDRANGSYPYEKSYNNKKSRAVRKESEDIQVLSEEQVDITLANIGVKINGDDQLPTKIQSFSTTEMVSTLERDNLSKGTASKNIVANDIVSN